MITVISGTDRPGSNSLKVANIVKSLLEKHTDSPINVLSLRDLPLNELNGSQYAENKPQKLVDAIDSLNKSDGIYMVIPEYNGSYPGALKHFIDHWEYPKTYESRPVAFLGLGGKFGGLRPVEHMQGVMGYRNAYMFPERIFLTNVWGILKDDQITDDTMNELLESQTKNFVKFIAGLKSQGLDANSK